MLDALLDAAPERRAQLLVELAGADPQRKAALERLLAECEEAYPLLDRPAGERFDGVFGDAAPAVPGILAERYELASEVGRGGMAVVYLARDLKHGRDVAVKVVRPELAAALGRARFLEEIRIAARLRHPHIVPLYDSGEQPGEPATDDSDAGPSVLYYVMPYEPGRSLRERLVQKGPLPVQEALPILHDVSDALAHAHRHGIVHRDIKPENILLAGANAMIADFGVARALSEASAGMTPATTGLVVGTLAYMAPEQARGDPEVDHRADIYSFGVLAHELVTGRTPSAPAEGNGSSSGDSGGAADFEALVMAGAPDELADLIVRCLARDPAERWQSADEMQARLAGIIALGPGRGVRDTGGQKRQRAVLVAGVALGALGLAAAAVSSARDRGEPPPLVLGRATQLTSESGLEVQPSISPDGKHVAYAAGHSVRTRIAVRPASGGKAIFLTQDTTSNEWSPRWSPDGTRILFLAREGVYSAPSAGGSPREEVRGRPGAMVRSATWSPDGREIAYVRGDSLLARTIATHAVRLIATGTDLHSCAWSPDGERIACVSGNSFFVTVGSVSGVGPMFGNLAPSRIVVVAARGGSPSSVTDSISLHQSPSWSRDGRTLYYVSNREGPGDVYALGISPDGTSRRAPVRLTTGMGAHSFDLSRDGTRFAYAVYASSSNIWAIPIPARPPVSAASAIALTSGNQTIEGVRVSPDGRWIIYDSDLSGNSDVYRMPIAGGEPERLTRDPADEFRGVLSPDGTELVYHSYRTGARNLFLLPVGGGPVQQLTRSPAPRSMANWSPDGTALAMFDISAARVLVMRRDGRGQWGPVRFTGGSGWRPEWSPDGRTIAFVSPADGRIRVVPADSGMQRDLYVPGPADPPAELAIFSADGRELYFKSHDASGRAGFWSVPARGGRPRLLVRFDDPGRASNRFEFASDGKQLLFTIEDRQSDIWVAEATGR